jgi:hypothetical protein
MQSTQKNFNTIADRRPRLADEAGEQSAAHYCVGERSQMCLIDDGSALRRLS